jgi:hypothetical protein
LIQRKLLIQVLITLKELLHANHRLPADLQFTKVGGKMGRYTFPTICMSNGVDALTTSYATKHKSTDSLKGK